MAEITADAGEVVAAYYAREGFVRPFMDVPEDPSVEDFNSAASSFPVFQVG